MAADRNKIGHAYSKISRMVDQLITVSRSP